MSSAASPYVAELEGDAYKYRRLKVNSSGHLRVTQSDGSILSGVEFDEIQASYPDSVTEVYVYKLATVTQATITVVYTTSSKDLIQSVVKA